MFDVEKPPYNHYLQLLWELRESDARRPEVAFREAKTSERGTFDANQQERARLAHVMLLRASAADVGLVRFLLEQEVTARRRDSFQGAGDTLTILSALLLDWGAPSASDTWLFWRAKRANFDTFAGGYDVKFVFAQLGPEAVLEVARERGTADDVKMLQKYDADTVVSELPAWREALAARYPRSAEGMDAAECESWAELFEDHDGLEVFGLQNAHTPEQRARLYRRLERFDAAVEEWRASALAADSLWDKAARLRSALTDAAKVPLAMPSEVDELEALRSQIPSWNEVGLGRMATQACYELAAALDGPDGSHCWKTAERWRADLTSFTLVGHRAALAAAKKWGSGADVDSLQAAVEEEHQRIYGT